MRSADVCPDPLLLLSFPPLPGRQDSSPLSQLRRHLTNAARFQAPLGSVNVNPAVVVLCTPQNHRSCYLSAPLGWSHRFPSSKAGFPPATPRQVAFNPTHTVRDGSSDQPHTCVLPQDPCPGPHRDSDGMILFGFKQETTCVLEGDVPPF